MGCASIAEGAAALQTSKQHGAGALVLRTDEPQPQQETAHGIFLVGRVLFGGSRPLQAIRKLRQPLDEKRVGGSFLFVISPFELGKGNLIVSLQHGQFRRVQRIAEEPAPGSDQIPKSRKRAGRKPVRRDGYGETVIGKR